MKKNHSVLRQNEFNFAKFRLMLKMWKDVSKTISCTSNLKSKWACHKSFPQTVLWGHSKSTSLAEKTFLNASRPCHILPFCHTLSPVSLRKFDETYKTEDFFLHMAVLAHHILKEVKKVIRELTFTHKYSSINKSCNQEGGI